MYRRLAQDQRRATGFGVGLAALLILALSRQPWLHGVAAGMLLLVVAQVVIDRYSENRATSYLAQLSLRAQ